MRSSKQNENNIIAAFWEDPEQIWSKFSEHSATLRKIWKIIIRRTFAKLCSNFEYSHTPVQHSVNFEAGAVQVSLKHRREKKHLEKQVK